jgi:hypothetical protein
LAGRKTTYLENLLESLLNGLSTSLGGLLGDLDLSDGVDNRLLGSSVSYSIDENRIASPIKSAYCSLYVDLLQGTMYSHIVT